MHGIGSNCSLDIWTTTLAKCSSRDNDSRTGLYDLYDITRRYMDWATNNWGSNEIDTRTPIRTT